MFLANTSTRTLNNSSQAVSLRARVRTKVWKFIGRMADQRARNLARVPGRAYAKAIGRGPNRLMRLPQPATAAAIAQTDNAAERHFLQRRLQGLGSHQP